MQTLIELVEKFEKAPSRNETDTRLQFIDPFFILLGWDVRNESGKIEAYRDVLVEERTNKIRSERPDYTFKLANEKKFFVEAKKPNVNIYSDDDPAKQTREYGYWAKLSISILTDFEEVAVYDTRHPIRKNDKANFHRIFYCKYNEYVKQWGFFQENFSKEAVNTGSLEKLVGESKKVTTNIDNDFLAEIEKWRKTLASNIALQNRTSKDQCRLNLIDLNLAVQMIIDRILFLKFAESRGMESSTQFKDLVKTTNIFQHLEKLFQKADKKYNSGLFYREGNRKFITQLNVGDAPLKEILQFLDVSSYGFKVLPVEILGSIYERFLGKTIYFTKSERAKIEEKPETRKAGGVYYTPKYIVDYIVENTVGEKLKNKTPKDVASLTILDPACGSGSFLVNAYEKLLNWHLEFYSNKKNLKQAIKEDKVYDIKSTVSKTYRLTINEKQRILVNNIYGVDIDRQAVEVSKLSLLLKLMEDENIASEEELFKHSDLQMLPNLANNIKSGNSLIGSDFYDGKTENLFPVEEKLKINVFDWDGSDGFPEIMKAGGFDCVIGNPPYGAELSQLERDYFNNKFLANNTDTAALLMLNGKRLLNKHGIISLIIPKSFTYASNWNKVRNILVGELNLIVDCSKVWKKVKYEMSIYRLTNGLPSKKYISALREKENIEEIGVIEKDVARKFGFILNGISKDELQIGKKIIDNCDFLNKFIINQRGAIYQKYISQNQEGFTVLGGKQISRFAIRRQVKGYLSSKIVLDENTFIKNKNSILVQNIVAHVTKPYPRIIIMATLPKYLILKKYVIIDTINQLTNTSKFKSEYLLGLLNSHLVAWYSYRFIFAKAIRTMHFDNPVTSRIPMIEPQKAQHDKMVSLVEQMLTTQKNLQETTSPSEKALYQKEADNLDKQIDQLVYELYELTPEEIKVVESGV